MYLRNYFAKIACRYYYVSFLPKLKTLWGKKIAIVKNNIAILFPRYVSRYYFLQSRFYNIDASVNRATPTDLTFIAYIVRICGSYDVLNHTEYLPTSTSIKI